MEYIIKGKYKGNNMTYNTDNAKQGKQFLRMQYPRIRQLNVKLAHTG